MLEEHDILSSSWDFIIPIHVRIWWWCECTWLATEGCGLLWHLVPSWWTVDTLWNPSTHALLISIHPSPERESWLRKYLFADFCMVMNYILVSAYNHFSQFSWAILAKTRFYCFPMGWIFTQPCFFRRFCPDISETVALRYKVKKADYIYFSILSIDGSSPNSKCAFLVIFSGAIFQFCKTCLKCPLLRMALPCWTLGRFTKRKILTFEKCINFLCYMDQYKIHSLGFPLIQGYVNKEVLLKYRSLCWNWTSPIYNEKYNGRFPKKWFPAITFDWSVLRR